MGGGAIGDRGGDGQGDEDVEDGVFDVGSISSGTPVNVPGGGRGGLRYGTHRMQTSMDVTQPYATTRERIIGGGIEGREGGERAQGGEMG